MQLALQTLTRMVKLGGNISYSSSEYLLANISCDYMHFISHRTFQTGTHEAYDA